MSAPAPREIWIGRAVDTLRELERAHAQTAHYRGLWDACWSVACEREARIVTLERQITELHDERRRYAIQLFGRTPADAPGEES